MHSSKIQTANGYIDLLSPEGTNFDIDSIAHALSQICRFTGHTRVFYSVAQHSVMCSYIYQEHFAFEKLLHDAQEAIVGDVATPLKRLIPDYRVIEKRLSAVLHEQYELDMERGHGHVKIADLKMLATEKRDLMPHHYSDEKEWAFLKNEMIVPLQGQIRPWKSGPAKHAFLARFYELCPEKFLNTARWQHITYHRARSFGCSMQPMLQD